MARSRAKLQPWIENLIINYGTDKEKNIANLKARVIAVGKMPQSQALGAEGPPELLFISDGAVQIPAIMTDTAWEHLQEEEERECFSSLVNTTVCLQTYSLRFHMAPEKTKSRFFLSLSKLAAMAAGSVKECPPCCTTLPSVRVKICDTWKALQDQNLSQTESSGFDLTELLGVWQYDCLVDLVEEVRERLTAGRRSTSPQPSTSRDPLARREGTRARTEWDIDRVRCKGSEPFSVPMAHLIIPSDPVAPPPKPATQPEEGSATQSGLIPPSDDQLVMHSTPAAPPHASTRGNSAQDVVGGCGFGKTAPPPRESILYACEAMLLEEMDNEEANPWNMFPPPSKVFCTSSSSEASPGSQVSAVSGARAPRGEPDQGVSPAAVEPSRGDQSFLPPYQNPAPLHPSNVSPTCPESSPPDRTAPAEPVAVRPSSGSASHGPAEEADPCSEKDPATSSAGAKRATHRRPGTAACPERGGAPRGDLSPPSWLFESQPGAVGEAGRGAERAGATGGSYRPAVHGDGSRFAYQYDVSLKNVQDLSGFRVADDRLHWAVKYLVAPKHADGSDAEVS